MDLGELVDGKLDVNYDVGVEERSARRNLKRKEKYGKQIKTAVNLMQVNQEKYLKLSASYCQTTPERGNTGVCPGKEVCGEVQGALFMPEGEESEWQTSQPDQDG